MGFLDGHHNFAAFFKLLKIKNKYLPVGLFGCWPGRYDDLAVVAGAG
jgi:hypothetical protein